MKIFNTNIYGVKIIEPDVYKDSRGYFTETYSLSKYSDIGICDDFLQDNESCSQKGTLRGLHYQKRPHTQSKLVRVIKGSVWDVVVDIRKNSSTYGQYTYVTLSEENKLQFYVPEGLAHGFLALEDNTIFSYKCNNFYHPESEAGIIYNDLDLKIKWPDIGCDYIISDKDKKHPKFKDIIPY